jgi:hypothetical protein
MEPVLNIQTIFVKNNSLIDTGDGRHYHEVILLGDMIARYGLQGARAKLAELRAEGRRLHERRLMTPMPPMRRFIFVERPRIRVSRRKVRAASAPKRSTRKSTRSSCHGRASDPDGGGDHGARFTSRITGGRHG